jgi:site-specific recombinase XerD
VRTLFAFAVKRKHLREDPALAVDLPKTEENPPGIVTPAQASAILDASLDHAPDILPVIVLTMFGGLRRSEAEQLDWAEVGEEFVEVKAHKAKTCQRRLVPIFDDGRRTLTRKDTVEAILTQTGFSVAAAYNALSPLETTPGTRLGCQPDSHRQLVAHGRNARRF